MKENVLASTDAQNKIRPHDPNWPVDFEPSHPKMGVLVKELGE